MKKKLYMKFSTPVPWNFVATLDLGDVTFVTYGALNRVHGFYCYPSDKTKCAGVLRTASIVHTEQMC